MVYVALLRGINVGGNNIVSMSSLARTFDGLGFGSVKTYINSGNVVFSSRTTALSTLTKRIEAAIEADFGFAVVVTVRDLPAMESLVAHIPATWVTDAKMRCDVMFLWNEFDKPSVLNDLQITPAIEDVRYHQGAVVWRIDRAHVNTSKMPKLIGTPLYKGISIRNANTVRMLLTLMRAAGPPR